MEMILLFLFVFMLDGIVGPAGDADNMCSQTSG